MKDVLLKTRAVESLNYRWEGKLVSLNFSLHQEFKRWYHVLNIICRRRLMLKKIFFDEDPDDVLKEEELDEDTLN